MSMTDNDTGAAFDLAALDTAERAEAGVEMAVCHPVSGEPLSARDGAPVAIRLAGLDSCRFERASAALAGRRLAAEQRGPDPEAGVDGLTRGERARFLAMVTVDWRGVALDGVVLSCTTDNAEKLYLRLPWLLDQIDRFVADRANFLPPSPGTYAPTPAPYSGVA